MRLWSMSGVLAVFPAGRGSGGRGKWLFPLPCFPTLSGDKDGFVLCNYFFDFFVNLRTVFCMYDWNPGLFKDLVYKKVTLLPVGSVVAIII